ncbi:hypothetical protein VL15_13860 [Burkholderia cepacia]|uniref:RND transporter n=2 Tax=Burkholderia cepacia TaxID=292 RepID=A0A0J5X5H9_BURCE|nr:hypothetical protein VL15_13860 [Burkholderia cepacia]
MNTNMSVMGGRKTGRLCGLWLRGIAWLVGVGMLSGCLSPTQLPDARQPVPADWRNRDESASAAAAAPADWWTLFRDPALDGLVATALSHNLTLAEAGYRLQAARAIARQAAAARLPQLDAIGELQRQQRVSGADGPGGFANETDGTDFQSGNVPFVPSDRASGYYQAGFDASWEIDLFGRLAAAADAARAGAGVAQADWRQARVTVIAELVRCYVELRGAQRRSALLAQSVSDQRERIVLTREKRAAGVASDFDVERVLAGAAELAARRAASDQAVQQAAQRIALLTGEPEPDDRWLAAAAQPAVPPVALRAVPADLLRTRPDIRRAERAIEQAAAELRVSNAELYPRLNLVGDIVVSGNLVGMPLPGRSTVGSGALSVTIPLLDWGARRAVVRAREAELAAAIVAYRHAVLEGIEETENALNALAAERRRAADLALHVDAARQTDAHAALLRQRGMTSRLERIEVGMATREADLATVEALEKQGLAIVALHKAVGGAAVGHDG